MISWISSEKKHVRGNSFSLLHESKKDQFEEQILVDTTWKRFFCRTKAGIGLMTSAASSRLTLRFPRLPFGNYYRLKMLIYIYILFSLGTENLTSNNHP